MNEKKCVVCVVPENQGKFFYVEAKILEINKQSSNGNFPRTIHIFNILKFCLWTNVLKFCTNKLRGSVFG